MMMGSRSEVSDRGLGGGIGCIEVLLPFFRVPVFVCMYVWGNSDT